MANNHAVPGAWYDLSGRLDAARAVAGCALDYLPVGDRAGPIRPQINHLGNLISAINDLLDMCITDANRIETELTRPPQ